MEIIPLFPFSAGELAGNTEGFLPRLFAGAITESDPVPVNEEIAARLGPVPLK